MSDTLNQQALDYHRMGRPGKIEVIPTKPVATQHDLALAYSPGVAAACMAIAEAPLEASTLTARSNLVAVVTNGTAVLGLGNIGPLAAKPVMEGKGVLFKKFSGIDVFDVEVGELDVERFCDVVAALEPTFGGINLEDIKAPECFEIERRLRERMAIPVFHDDQHGTAIVTSAFIINGLKLVDKPIGEVRLVTSGAGAAALACLDLLVALGMRREHILVTDRKGVIHMGRQGGLDVYKSRWAADTEHRTLAEAIDGADIFLGCSGPGILTADMVARMAKAPLILALANPDPEIEPEVARAVRADAIIATGRSDYPNQVNNVLCFPFIFRGALDVGATEINEAMKMACVHAISKLAQAEPSELVTRVYRDEAMRFGPEFLIPKPFDPRLIVEVATAVAKAAMESGVATRPIEDMAAYRRRLGRFVFRSGSVMEPVFEQAREHPQRVVYAEGESRRVLQAVQQLLDEGAVKPILVGRPEVVEARIAELGLRLKHGDDYELTNPHSDERFREYWGQYHAIMGRKGVSPGEARTVIRTQNTAIAAIMLRRGEADAMICGTEGRFSAHLQHVRDIIGKAEGVFDFSALSALILPRGTCFVCDTHITPDPTAEEIAEMAVLSVQEVRRFGIEPKVALLSHSNFGSHNDASADKMRAAHAMLQARMPDLMMDGEMHADSALSDEIRKRSLPESALSGEANLLIMPNLDAAHITYGALRVMGGGVAIGPILIGAAKPVHVVTSSVTARGLVNMSALAVVDAAAVAGA
jgi:malate dehydrogenase (oxaloacetate-decarboxylating)(NADP+)